MYGMIIYIILHHVKIIYLLLKRFKAFSPSTSTRPARSPGCGRESRASASSSPPEPERVRRTIRRIPRGGSGAVSISSASSRPGRPTAKNAARQPKWASIAPPAGTRRRCPPGWPGRRWRRRVRAARVGSSRR